MADKKNVMNTLSGFSKECFQQCPGMHSSVNEHALREASGEEVSLADVILEHQEAGTLPKNCEKGPINRGPSSLSSRALMSEVALSTVLRQDAWGDLVSIRCRAQGDIGGGTIIASS